MAPEILSRQASPVDGLLSSLKSANLVFFGFPYVSVADVNPIYRIGRRVEIFPKAPVRPFGFQPWSKLSTWLYFLMYLQILRWATCIDIGFSGCGSWFARPNLTLHGLRNFNWICRPRDILFYEFRWTKCEDCCCTWTQSKLTKWICNRQNKTFFHPKVWYRSLLVYGRCLFIVPDTVLVCVGHRLSSGCRLWSCFETQMLVCKRKPCWPSASKAGTQFWKHWFYIFWAMLKAWCQANEVPIIAIRLWRKFHTLPEKPLARSTWRCERFSILT